MFVYQRKPVLPPPGLVGRPIKQVHTQFFGGSMLPPGSFPRFMKKPILGSGRRRKQHYGRGIKAIPAHMMSYMRGRGRTYVLP